MIRQNLENVRMLIYVEKFPFIGYARFTNIELHVKVKYTIGHGQRVFHCKYFWKTLLFGFSFTVFKSYRLREVKLQ